LTSEDQEDKIKKTKKVLCLSCARDTRGKYQLNKLTEKYEFFCDANKGKLMMSGFE
jgi:hypothetical protein